MYHAFRRPADIPNPMETTSLRETQVSRRAPLPLSKENKQQEHERDAHPKSRLLARRFEEAEKAAQLLETVITYV